MMYKFGVHFFLSRVHFQTLTEVKYSVSLAVKAIMSILTHQHFKQLRNHKDVRIKVGQLSTDCTCKPPLGQHACISVKRTWNVGFRFQKALHPARGEIHVYCCSKRDQEDLEPIVSLLVD